MPCAAARYFAEEDNWIELTDENIAAVDFERARKAKHVIGAEFDSMDGHQISGSKIKEILEQAREDGYSKALLILDAAYQFAVSIGVYVQSE